MSDDEELIQDEEDFNPRETATMKQIRKLLQSNEPDWARIKHDQNAYLILLALQNVFQLWLLYLLYLMKLGAKIADAIVFPVDIILISIYVYTLVMVQYKEEDWRYPPFNFLLYFANFLSRTFLAIFVIFEYTWVHLEIVTIMLTIDLVLVWLCFLIDKKHKNQCFLAKDYWWRAVIIFMLQEILVNFVYDIYDWSEVFAWFAAYFLILCHVLWQCQMIRYRPYMSFYANSFYLGQIYYDSDIVFPCSLIKLCAH